METVDETLGDTTSCGSEGLEIYSPTQQQVNPSSYTGDNPGLGNPGSSPSPPGSSSGMYSLRWNGFEGQVTGSLMSLYSSEELTDVTLACDDGVPIKAHKLILAMSSTFFKQIFKVIKGFLHFLQIRIIMKNYHNFTSFLFRAMTHSFLNYGSL